MLTGNIGWCRTAISGGAQSQYSVVLNGPNTQPGNSSPVHGVPRVAPLVAFVGHSSAQKGKKTGGPPTTTSPIEQTDQKGHTDMSATEFRQIDPRSIMRPRWVAARRRKSSTAAIAR